LMKEVENIHALQVVTSEVAMDIVKQNENCEL